MLYATKTGTVPAPATAEAEAATSLRMLLVLFQLPNHLDIGWDAILSIWSASAGRDARQASAVLRALDA